MTGHTIPIHLLNIHRYIDKYIAKMLLINNTWIKLHNQAIIHFEIFKKLKRL